MRKVLPMGTKQQKSVHPSDFLRSSSGLVLEPGGNNNDLLDKLIARADELKKPCYLIDILTMGELIAIYACMKERIDKNLGSQSEIRLEQMYSALMEAMPWLVYEEQQQELQIKKAIYKLLTPDIVQDIQNKANNPTDLANAIADVVIKMAKSGGVKKNIFNNKAKDFAQEIAKEQWKNNPSLIKEEVAEYIDHHLHIKFSDEADKNQARELSIETIKKWISPVMPAERKNIGRPRLDRE